MQNVVLAKAIIVWLCIAVAEVCHGVVRVRLLNPRVGDRSARQIATVSGSVLVLIISWLFVPWIGANSVTQWLAVGFTWLVLMLGLEAGFGRFVFHASWRRIASDFNLRRGRLLIVGMIILFFAPLIAAKMRRML